VEGARLGLLGFFDIRLAAAMAEAVVLGPWAIPERFSIVGFA
jgi:hypothetical protein